MSQPIPESWRCKVVEVLKTYDKHFIEWTRPALQRWQTDTFGATRSEAYDSLIPALSAPSILGNETTSYEDQAGAYEFFFQHNRKDMYGKIALMKDGVRILILSAHNPKRSSL